MSNNPLRVRIGKTLNIAAKVLIGEEAESLEGRDLTVFLVNPRGIWKRITGWTLTGSDTNKVTFTFQGKDQRGLGTYRLVVYENYESNNQSVLDRNIVTLVPYSSMETDAHVTGLSDTEIDIDLGSLTFTGPRGFTPYAQDGYWFINGVTTGIRCDYSSEEALRASAETARVTAEQNRANAESARSLAEDARVLAEQARVAAEALRVQAEQGRVNVEALRVTAEDARVLAEQARVTAEAARAQAEALRVQAEQTRSTNFQTQLTNQQTSFQNQLSAQQTTFEGKMTDIDTAVATLMACEATLTAVQNQLATIGPKIIQSGTFEQAYAKSQTNNIVFPWLLVDTVDGDSIIKPIWHVGNSVFVDAAGATISISASAPSVPTITIDGSTATSGSTVAKGTQIIITPSSGVLYYKTSNDASYTASTSAVTITLGTTGNITIQAYCTNSAGNSSVVSVTLTVEGTAVPVFSAASGEVSRGATITITASGTLYYSTDGGTTWTNGGTSASVQITDDTTIQAYNVVDGDQSDTVSRTYTMAALAAPTFSIASGTEIEAGGQDVVISASGSSIKYTTDGTDPSSSGTATTVSGTSATINVASAMTIRAIAVDAYGTSAEASATYTIAVDAKFQFKIALTGDNSTEYVPVITSGAPKYTMTVDWGDGSDVESYTSQRFSNKGLSHAYSGIAGDEFTITLRGTAIPALYFSYSSANNVAALVEIVDNTLECNTFLTVKNSNLRSICVNAFQNNTNTGRDTVYPVVIFNCSSLTSIPDGLLSHLTKSGVALTSCNMMFTSSYLALTSSQLNELKSVIGSVTNFGSMFVSFKGTAAIPDDFFDGVSDGIVTSVLNLFHLASSGLTGDAAVLYTALLDKVTSDATTTRCFNASSLSNRDQVPSAWGGTAS